MVEVSFFKWQVLSSRYLDTTVTSEGLEVYAGDRRPLRPKTTRGKP